MLPLLILLSACRSPQPKKPPVPIPTVEAADVQHSSPTAASPARFYVRTQDVTSRYLEALRTDPRLKEAYEGFYLKTSRTFEQVWDSIKRQADRVTRIAAIYPATALPMGAYHTVRSALGKGEDQYKKRVTKEDEVAGQVQADIVLAVQRVAQGHRIQLVFDYAGAGLLYLDPAWDLTDLVLATLVETKAVPPPAAQQDPKTEP